MLVCILILSSLEFVLPEGNVLLPPSSQQPMYRFQQKHHPLALPIASVHLADYYPFNVTISHLSPRSIGINWSCKDNTLHDKYEVTIKPLHASYKVVETVPNNMCFLLMDKLEPDTTYQVAVASVAGRNRKRSGYVIFRTFMEDDYTDFTEDDDGDQQIFDGSGDDPSDNAKAKKARPRVRLVEISLVAMALVLWAGAILLFFHRWGKIRMLLPYQEPYKKMENNATSCTTCSMTPHHQCQKIQHMQNPTAESYQAQGMTMTTTTSYHPTTPRPYAPRLPHQPLSLPGPSNCLEDESNMVTVTESGCSPMRPKMTSFNEGDMSIDQMSLYHHQRKTRSAEQLKQYVYPWEEPSQLECTEF